MFKNVDNGPDIQNIQAGKPHVVILGAGASLAAFPNGDKNGKRLPLMNNLIEVVGLGPFLEKAGIYNAEGNFEDIYEKISSDPQKGEIAQEIEEKVFAYFSSLELPEQPTLYDHLVLSLRENDLIATFNWDPFLFWSLQRNHENAPMPHHIYLHGNVAIGYCLKCQTFGYYQDHCRICNRQFERSPLLFPIREKGYTKNPFIDAGWKILREYLKSAYILTIFGYSAPQSDVEAISLLKESWGPGNSRSLEEIEIIDIKKSDELQETWNDFICRNHAGVTTGFYNSWLAKHPRRSCEALWWAVMMQQPFPNRQIPREAEFSQLWDWFKPFVDVEPKGNWAHHT